MAVIVNTLNRQRARLRPGRQVQYHPMEVETFEYGPGPFIATISEVNPDGTMNVVIMFPPPLVGYDVDVNYDDTEMLALREVTLGRIRRGVPFGFGPGQCSFLNLAL